jgi:hypothetical protein
MKGFGAGVQMFAMDDEAKTPAVRKSAATSVIRAVVLSI